MLLGSRRRIFQVVSASLALAAPASAQSFISTPAQIPANAGYTENVDFADVDGDGDRDAALAEGGDFGNDRNKLWINRGFEPGGTAGFFADRTAAQFPAILDDSLDVDFADLDGDGDSDLQISNTSSWVNQPSRWWINMGGAQGGTPGFFTDQTQARWTFLGVNDGVAHFSSLAPSLVLPGGGFVDWSGDNVLGDLDADGDPDLFHSSYGATFNGRVPSRIFLNDGAGFFEEFNPSGVQLAGATIPDGAPALWCEGAQQHATTDATGQQSDIADTPLGVELGDVDGDLDVDVLQGARDQVPRSYRNRATDTGAFVAFRDVTHASGYAPFVDDVGNSESEYGDFDNDDDLDVYGVDWSGVTGLDSADLTLRNDGAGVFGDVFELGSSSFSDSEGEFGDFDNDGLLDLFVVVGSGFPYDRMYRNPGGPGWHLAYVHLALSPSPGDGLGADACDVDLDSDSDLLVAVDQGQPELLYVNATQVIDTIAPRANHLEQAPNRIASSVPTPVRVHVYDNSSWEVARYDVVTLEYSWNGGADWHAAPMRHGGGQLFRGEIRGDVAGTIQYRVRASDERGNTGVSVVKTYLASGCTGNVFAYCTAGTTGNGCAASIAASGIPSVAQTSGFVLTASGVDGARFGLTFYGLNGRSQQPWGAGTSLLCVKSPLQRTSAQFSGGTAGQCDGALALDWLAFLAATPGALGNPFGAGQVVDAQAWFRDPPSAKSTSLSNALEFTTCP
jgi:hypothetical protein